MLLEFQVANYRSIKDEQSLSLVPIAKDSTLYSENVYDTGDDLVRAVLRGGAIYGANASGKSNLLNSMAFMQAMVRDSATKIQAGEILNVQGYAFDEALRRAPTSFELTAFVGGTRYQYGFSLTPERIHAEWLLVYKSSKPQEWFSRTWNRETAQYEYATFSAYFTGAKDLWKRSTRESALFLSTAVQLNSEQLKPLWDWIVSSWIIIPAQAGLNIDLTLNAIEKTVSKRAVLEFLNSADIAIEDVLIQMHRAKQSLVTIDGATGKASVSDGEAEIRVPLLKHSAAGKTATFGFQDESHGTQRLFAFAGLILFVLERGMTLMVDEIESSMHPLLVRHMLKLFFSPDSNSRGAQIIFSTHSTVLLDNGLLRRDQIWFTEKGSDHSTLLIPFSDFSPRKKEAFEKGYLEGRYGAIPILSESRASS